MSPEPNPASASARKRLLKLGIRLAVSGALLAYLLHQIDLSALGRALSGAKLPHLLVAFLIAWSSLGVASLRWRTVLGVRAKAPPFPLLLYWYHVGAFFNAFLPTTIGGDVARALGIAKGLDSRSRAIGSVLAERVLGVLALATIATLGLVFFGGQISQGELRTGLLVLCLVLALGVALVLSPRALSRLSRLIRRSRWSSLADRFDRVLEPWLDLLAHPPIVGRAFLLSVLNQAFVITGTYVLGRGLGLGADLGYYCLAVPVIWLIIMLPISVNGLGVREAAFTFFFTQVGEDAAHALALSLLWFALSLIVGAIGGLLWAIAPEIRWPAREGEGDA